MSDEERDLRKYSRRSAIGLMGVGGGLAATETLGFTQLSADRGVNVAVADDANAVLVVVDDDSDGSLEDEAPFDDDVTIKFENQSDTNIEADDLEVTISNQSGSDDINIDGENDDFGSSKNISEDEEETFKTDLDASQSKTLLVELDDKSETSDATIDVEVHADFGSGSFSIDLTRSGIDIDGTE